MKLFHLSDTNHDGKIFKPRVPHSLMMDSYARVVENNRTRRVCFSKTITGAFYAINFRGGYETLYVHVPENIDDIVSSGKIVIPSDKDVSDAEYCSEVWVKCPVKMKCIGKINIGYRLSIIDNRPRVHWKWIERY